MLNDFFPKSLDRIETLNVKFQTQRIIIVSLFITLSTRKDNIATYF